MLKHAIDRSVWLGWLAVFLVIMTAFLWDSAVQIVIERDRNQYEAQQRKLRADHAAKFPGYNTSNIGPASERAE